MDRRPHRSTREDLPLLRDALARLKRRPDPYFNDKAIDEFKFILTTRIAALEAEAARTLPEPKAFAPSTLVQKFEFVVRFPSA